MPPTVACGGACLRFGRQRRRAVLAADVRGPWRTHGKLASAKTIMQITARCSSIMLTCCRYIRTYYAHTHIDVDTNTQTCTRTYTCAVLCVYHSDSPKPHSEVCRARCREYRSGNQIRLKSRLGPDDSDNEAVVREPFIGIVVREPVIRHRSDPSLQGGDLPPVLGDRDRDEEEGRSSVLGLRPTFCKPKVPKYRARASDPQTF